MKRAFPLVTMNYSSKDCNIIQIGEIEEEDWMTTSHKFPPEYKEYKDGIFELNDTPTHNFERDKMIKYEETKINKLNLGDRDNPQVIMVGDNWDPLLKVTTFKIFME